MANYPNPSICTAMSKLVLKRVWEKETTLIDADYRKDVVLSVLLFSKYKYVSTSLLCPLFYQFTSFLFYNLTRQLKYMKQSPSYPL